MGIREKLNENPVITGAVTGAVILAALIWILYDQFPTSASSITTAFYTVDDGQTWFADDAYRVTPFDYNGQPAVKAYVFKCSDGGEFVGFLERFTEEGRKQVQKMLDEGVAPEYATAEIDYAVAIEVKRPGQSEWVKPENNQKYEEITEVKCPDGSFENLRPVHP